MNTKTLKGMGAAASLLIGIGAASPALATFTPPQILGPHRTASMCGPSAALRALPVP